MKFFSSILIETVIGVSFLPGDYYYLTLNEVIRCHPKSGLLTKNLNDPDDVSIQWC